VVVAFQGNTSEAGDDQSIVTAWAGVLRLFSGISFINLPLVESRSH